MYEFTSRGHIHLHDKDDRRKYINIFAVTVYLQCTDKDK